MQSAITDIFAAEGEEVNMDDQATEDVRKGREVIIHLMPSSTAEKEGSASESSGKRKRVEDEGMEGPEAENGLAPLCEILADSTTLRECSKYFESLMSGRWSIQTEGDQPSSAMKFYLEVQTEERYYHDCFSRMLYLHQPIGSVNHCIELLKVASQIEYKKLMDLCMLCLSARPWTSEEEEQIREFCVSGQYLSSDSATDLSARLQLPLTKREKEKKLARCAQRALNRYLWCAFESNEMVKREEGREAFERALQAIVSGAVSENNSESVKLLQTALDIVKDASDMLFSSVKVFDYGEDVLAMPLQASARAWGNTQACAMHNEKIVFNLWWLFQTLRKANAAQAVAELLLEHGEFAELLMQNFDLFGRRESRRLPTRGIETSVRKKIDKNLVNVKTTMREMIVAIFEDVLNGRLFLTSSDRMKLFLDWNWLLHDCSSPCPHPSPCSSFADESATSRATSRATVLASYMMSFPLEQQEEISCIWMSRETQPEHDFLLEGSLVDYCDLKQAHMMWMVNLVSQVPLHKLQQLAAVADHGTSCKKRNEGGTSIPVPTEGGSAYAMVRGIPKKQN